MQERFGTLIWAGALAVAACGGVEDGASLVQSRAALSCQTDTDCGDGYACAHFSQRSYCEPMAASTPSSGNAGAPVAAPACQNDGDCGPGEECESEHGRAYYCARHGEEGKEHANADAGADATQDSCRHGGDDCSHGDTCTDAGPRDECDDHAGDEDRSGPNRGPH
jgi:hypothetical protein